MQYTVIAGVKGKSFNTSFLFVCFLRARRLNFANDSSEELLISEHFEDGNIFELIFILLQLFQMNCLKMHLEDDVDYTLIYLNLNLFRGCSSAGSKKSAERIRILDKFRVFYVRTTTLANNMGLPAPTVMGSTV